MQEGYNKSRKGAIRFGGQEVDGHFRYELTGGALALDFINTLDERPAGGIERLTSYARLIDWSIQTGVLGDAGLADFINSAAALPEIGDVVVRSARQLRETIFNLVQAIVQNRDPNKDDAIEFNRWLARAGTQRRLIPGADGSEWRLSYAAEAPDRVLFGIVESAASLLTDERLRPRLRLCAAESCDWSFLDMTRRRNRLWCDMSVCGNRAKARRHYSKSKAISPPKLSPSE